MAATHLIETLVLPAVILDDGCEGMQLPIDQFLVESIHCITRDEARIAEEAQVAHGRYLGMIAAMPGDWRTVPSIPHYTEER